MIQGGESDRVFQGDDGLWNFWDGTGTFFYGPYDTEEEARAALDVYVDQIGGS